MKPTTALRAFGLNVRRQREAKKMTQEVLAEKAGLHPTYLSGVERGVRNPSLQILFRIARGLDTTVSDLSNGIDK
jgi:transcriptional regulator with XRE-family HTH domain